MQEKIIIYPAAALFNGRETYFNSQLVEGLETLGYKTNFPQRDGFEFGNLASALSGKLSQDEVSSAVENVIYFLDMGVLMPGSDVIIANLDEPLDEGVAVEASYGKLMGKFNIGIRTDVRSPYGPSENRFGGMHFFPAYQWDVFLRHYMPCKTCLEGHKQMDALTRKIDEEIKHSGVKHKQGLPDYAIQNPIIANILKGANILFDGVGDIHSEYGIKEIAQRYLDNKLTLESAGPRRYSQ
jgi:nucleoside 2-deoxyribosyltransferase